MNQRLALLKQPGFSFYLVSCFLSTFGSGLSYITANWLILKVHNDVMTVLVMMICFWLPNALLGPFWGVLVDRYSKQALLVLSNFARFIILFCVAGITYYYHLSVPLLDVLMLLLGSLFGIMLPAQVAFVRELVDKSDLLYANTSVDIVFEVGNVIGMSSAGFLLIIASGALSFFINAFLFLLAAVVILLIPLKQVEKTPVKRKPAAEEFVKGLEYVGRDKTLRLIYSIQLLILAAFMITPVLIAPFARNILHATSQEFGLIEAALSVGVIIGGFSLPAIVRKFGFNDSLLFLTSGLVVFFVWFGFNTSLAMSGILYAMIGFVLSSWPLILTKAQDRTDFAYQGRVQSVFSSVSSMVVLVVYLFIALGAHVIPLNLLYLFPALLGVLAVCLIWRLRLHTV